MLHDNTSRARALAGGPRKLTAANRGHSSLGTSDRPAARVSGSALRAGARLVAAEVVPVCAGALAHAGVLAHAGTTPSTRLLLEQAASASAVPSNAARRIIPALRNDPTRPMTSASAESLTKRLGRTGVGGHGLLTLIRITEF